MPDTELEGARQLSEAMRENVVGLCLEHKASEICPHVTASLGIASAVPGREAVYAELMRMADQALYAAEKGGRNGRRPPPG